MLNNTGLSHKFTMQNSKKFDETSWVLEGRGFDGGESRNDIMPRIREVLHLGILSTGPHNAITDVPGVAVGHCSVRGGSLRTGVTAVLMHGHNLFREKLTAGCAVLNGYGKSLGLMQIEELGTIETPVLITSTLNVPRAADALISYLMAQDEEIGVKETVNPIVLECFDGYLSDARARAVGEREVAEAIRTARGGPVEEGCVGAGVGMRCQGYKSGVGTSSRVVAEPGFILGVLAAPNFGFPGDLMIAGVPVGRELAAVGQPSESRTNSPGTGHTTSSGGSGEFVGEERGSCIFVVATDAPLAAIDLRRIAWRCFLGMARTGAISGQTSGDVAVAFTTNPKQQRQERSVMNGLFRAAVEASEEAILNALFAAETTVGRDGHVMPALPMPETQMILKRHGVPLRNPDRSD